MDRLVGRHLTLDGVEKADEFLMPVALHFAHGSWSSAAIATMFALGRGNARSSQRWATDPEARRRLGCSVLTAMLGAPLSAVAWPWPIVFAELPDRNP
jgi:hypothetical protein